MKVQNMYTTIDVHVAGEAFRIIKDVPLIQYTNLEELQRKLLSTFMQEIKLLLQEPRGFAGINGCMVVPPIDNQADAAALFFNHEGVVAPHYGGIVAIVTALLESGQLKQKESNRYKIETIRGLFSVIAIMEDSEVVSVTIKSEPCFIVEENAVYTLIQADQLYAVFPKHERLGEIRTENLSTLKDWMRTTYKTYFTTNAVQRIVLMDDRYIDERRIKTVTFRDDEYIVRSPGFGSTMACYMSSLSKIHGNKELPFINESMFHSFVTIQKVEQVENGYAFTMTSRGFITGMQTFLLEPTDPFPEGFLLK